VGENPICNKPVRLNGKLFYVTGKLHSALQTLRGPTELVIVWADALCITQKSHIESNTQVLLMSSVYGGAKRVIIWLGPVADELDEFAVWWLQLLRRAMPSLISTAMYYMGFVNS
jgi:hypothetical protein